MATRQQKSNDATSIMMPAILAYKRSIEPTLFSMYASIPNDNGANLIPIVVTKSTMRCTVSNYSSKESPAQRVGIAKNSLENANIQTVESTYLPANSSVLVVKGHVRFCGHSFTPVMHDSPRFVSAINEFLEDYNAANGYYELALRYMLNLASGRFMWRNSQGDDLEISLKVKGNNKPLILNECDVNMMNGFTLEAITNEQKREQFKVMVTRVANTLGKASVRSVAIEVEATIDMGPGAEVYPSQDFISADDKSNEKALSKVLAKSILSDGREQAIFHPQKIGNAVRTIDTWHGDETAGVIAIEPFGANTQMKRAHRVSGNDFYTYFKDPVLLKSELEKGISDVHHFVAACLIRGGSYGMSDKTESAA